MWSSILRSQRKRFVIVAAAAIAAASTAVPIEVAHMRLPQELAGADRLAASGYGGKNRGQFAIADYRGHFTRIESRFAVFDPLYAANRGKASFTLEGPGLTGMIEAECRFEERVLTVGVLTFDAAKLAYFCEIRDSDGREARLTLGEPKRTGFKQRLLARAERRGVAEFGDLRIDIASVHQYERSKLSSQSPVGYVLSIDSEPVGRLELTDFDPTFIFRTNLPGDVHHATLVAALALSVLRDPASSALGD
jgi:hypothetical protein